MVRLNEYEEYNGYRKAKEIQDYLDTDVKRFKVRVDDTLESEYLVHSYHRTSDIIRMNNLQKDDTLMGLRFSLNMLMFVTQT